MTKNFKITYISESKESYANIKASNRREAMQKFRKEYSEDNKIINVKELDKLFE